MTFVDTREISAARAAEMKAQDKEASKAYYQGGDYLQKFEMPKDMAPGTYRVLRFIVPDYVTPQNLTAFNHMGITYCFASAATVGWGKMANYRAYVDPSPFGQPNPYGEYSHWITTQGTKTDRERLAEIRFNRSHHAFVLDITDQNSFNLGLQMWSNIPFSVVEALTQLAEQRNPMDQSKHAYPCFWHPEQGFPILVRRFASDGGKTKYEIKPYMAGNEAGQIVLQCGPIPNAVEVMKQANENDIGGFIYLETEETIREMLSGKEVDAKVKRTRRELRDKMLGRDPVCRFKDFTKKGGDGIPDAAKAGSVEFNRPPVTTPNTAPAPFGLPATAAPPAVPFVSTVPAREEMPHMGAPAPAAAFVAPPIAVPPPVAAAPAIQPPGTVAAAASTPPPAGMPPWLQKQG